MKNKFERLCIYFIFDKDGIVDDYIIYQLIELKKSIDYLFCVVNGYLNEEYNNKLREITDCLFIRDNKGNDIGAYKAAIEKIQWENIRKYDELIIMNFTCFGPVYPFEEVFKWSEELDVDFWGLTLDKKTDFLNGKKYLHSNKCEYHYQSNFIAIRKSLLNTVLLEDFFNSIPNNTNYIESGSYFEYAFPGYFEEQGFLGAVYCNDLMDLNYPLLFNPVTLLKKYRMPLIKKRSFFHHYTDVLNNSSGESAIRLLRYIQKNTKYDTRLIWQSLLRSCALSDIARNVHLNRIISNDNSLLGSNTGLSVGVIFHAFYEDLFEETFEYILNVPSKIDILITTDSECKKRKLEELIKRYNISCTVKIVQNRGRDIAALLVGAYDFVLNHDLICFAHDKKTSQVQPYSVGRSWSYKLKENVLASKEYIENIIYMFQKEELLGIAFPSYPNHGIYAKSLGTGWTGNFHLTKEFLGNFDIYPKIHEHTLCVAPLGTCFWFRTKALLKLFKGINGKKWEYVDFPLEPNKSDNTILHVIERSFAYFAQDAGYYPVYLYNDKYAEIEFTNLEFNKSGSLEMRAWVEKLALDAIGIGNNAQTNEEVIKSYDGNINYGIRQSLIHLAYAIRIKYPVLWGFLLPIRRIGQKLLGIRTK